jgi:hypothetical protein
METPGLNAELIEAAAALAEAVKGFKGDHATNPNAFALNANAYVYLKGGAVEFFKFCVD